MQPIDMNERIGTVERTRVLDLLGNALTEGYLELSEYEHRVGLVSAAKTVGELVTQVKDLPKQFRWLPGPAPQAAAATSRPRETHATAVASLVLAIISIPLAVCYGIGGLFGIAAVVLSRHGLRSTTDHGMATAGLVIGCLGIVSSLAILALFILMPSST